MRVVASIGDELCGKAGSADAGGYRGVLLIKGAVPGPRGSIVTVSDSVKSK